MRGASFKVSEDDTSAMVISADHLVDGSVVHIITQARDTAAAALCSHGACSRVGDWGYLWGAAALGMRGHNTGGLGGQRSKRQSCQQFLTLTALC